MRKYLLCLLIIFSLFAFQTIAQNESVRSENIQYDIPEINELFSAYEKFYTVQVGIFSSMKTSDDLFDIKNLYYSKFGPYWRYISGVYSTYEEAEAEKTAIMELGFYDAFVAIFRKPQNWYSGESSATDIVEQEKYSENYGEFTQNEYDYVSNEYFVEVVDSLNKRIDVISSIEKKTEKSEKKEVMLNSWYGGDQKLLYIVALISLFSILLIIIIAFRIGSRNKRVKKQLEQNRNDLIGEVNKVKEDVINNNNETRKLVMISGVINKLPLSNKNVTKPKRVEKRDESSEMEKKIKDQIKGLKERSKEGNTDHSLAIEIATSITRMKMNINDMPASTAGLVRLKGVVSRLEREFKNANYNIVDLFGKEHEKDMDIKAIIVPSKELKPGESIISNIVKPRITYKDEIIQKGEIEVKTGK